MKKHIIAALWLLLLPAYLISATGLQVFHHYCNSRHTSETALLIPSFSCEHDHNVCEHTNSASDCCPHNQTPDESNCCDTFAEYHKLDIPQLSPKSDKTVPVNFAIAIIYLFIAPTAEFFYYETLSLLPDPSPPPLCSGKFKRILLTQLNIAPELA